MLRFRPKAALVGGEGDIQLFRSLSDHPEREPGRPADRGRRLPRRDSRHLRRTAFLRAATQALCDPETCAQAAQTSGCKVPKRPLPITKTRTQNVRQLRRKVLMRTFPPPFERVVVCEARAVGRGAEHRRPGRADPFPRGLCRSSYKRPRPPFPNAHPERPATPDKYALRNDRNSASGARPVVWTAMVLGTPPRI